MTLEPYGKKRDFTQTREPPAQVVETGQQRFVAQEHHASQLHYDFRLEMGGVLKSWAIPKGPSLDPKVKHMAIQVEDHPVEYLHFEGDIAEGNYGAGQVLVWDTGTYALVDQTDPLDAYETGKLRFVLNGEKLRGQFNLIRMKNREKQWLLLKSRDEWAQAGWELEPMLKPGKPARAKKMRAKKKSEMPRSATARPRAVTTPPKETLYFEKGATQITIPNLERTLMPETIQPMLATLVDHPFSDHEWLFETKWDGVRALCFIESGKTRLVSRNQNEMSFRYPELANVANSILAGRAVLDGEIVALDEHGHPSFQRLQSRVGLESAQDIQRLAREQPVVYYVFDLLYYNGFNLMSAPLIQRKMLLQAILQPTNFLRISEHVVGDGPGFYARVQAENQEGIVAKQLNSHYFEGRSGHWLKLKTVWQQEVVIGGYTQPRRSREWFGALVAGLYRDGKLVSVGHVGGGFERASLERVYKMMQPLKTDESPFAETPPTNEQVQWIQPKLVAEVKFAGWTRDAQMRQPIFLGLRDDKPPEECTFEHALAAQAEVKKAEETTKSKAKRRGISMSLSQFVESSKLEGEIQVNVDGQVVSLTHLDKPYWQKDGIAKGDLLRYYAQIAPTLLPYLEHRPLILKRFPNGIEAPFFFQHDLPNAPDFVRTEPLESREDRSIKYAVIDNAATLLYLTNLGTIEEHPWHSRVEDIEHPDWVVFDLDPEEAEFDVVCQVAQAVRQVLEQWGLRAYAKTSGSRGMHILVPIEPRYRYAQTARFTERVAALVAKENPQTATVVRALSQRKAGRVYIDHLQNAKGKTIAAPYSVRARAGATVSAPLEWKEVKAGLRPQQFTLKTMPNRLREKGDLFKGVLDHSQSLDEALKQIEKRTRVHAPRVAARPS